MFNIKENETSIRFDTSSEMRHVDRIIREARYFLEQVGLEIFSEFKIVVRELLINAIEHGNGSKVDQIVSCTITQLPDMLFKVIVKDQGKGFDYQSLDMAFPQDPKAIRNRGYALIHEFTEKIMFNKKGNQVTVYLQCMPKTGFTVNKKEDWQIICPSGDITASVADEFRVLLDKLMEKNYSKYRFDMMHVTDLDSVGLSVLLVLAKMLSEKKGTTEVQSNLEMTNVNPDLMRLFSLTSLDTIYMISQAA